MNLGETLFNPCPPPTRLWGSLILALGEPLPCEMAHRQEGAPPRVAAAGCRGSRHPWPLSTPAPTKHKARGEVRFRLQRSGVLLIKRKVRTKAHGDPPPRPWCPAAGVEKGRVLGTLGGGQWERAGPSWAGGCLPSAVCVCVGGVLES